MCASVRSRIGWLFVSLLLPVELVAQVSEVTKARTPSDSVSWYRSHNPRQALDYGFRFLRGAQDNPVSGEMAEVYTEMGNVYLDQGLRQPAVEVYSQALTIWRQLHKWERAGWSYNDLGYVYDVQKQPQLALAHYRHGASLFREAGARGYVGLGHTLTNIGSLYQNQHQYAKASTTFRQALTLFRKANAYDYEAKAYRSLGVNALLTGRLDEARQNMGRALAHFSATADFNQVGLCYLALGQRADSLRAFPEAQQFYRSAIQAFGRMNNHEYLAITLLRQGQSHRLMGQLRQAVLLVAQALDTALRYQLHPLQLKTLRELATDACASGDPARALTYYQQALAEKEALTGSQIGQATLQKELEQQWVTAKVEADRFAADRQRQRLRFLGLGALAVALVGVVALLLLFLRQTRRLARQDKQLLTQQEELSRLQAEQLAHELHQRQHELGTMALELVRSNEQLGEILGEVNQLKPYLNGEGQRLIQQLVLRRHLQVQDEHWRVFDREFQRLHTNFYDRLEHRYPVLTANERQLCALLRMRLSNTEITAITLRTLNSVHAAKSRLRKKLGVELDEEMQGVLDAL